MQTRNDFFFRLNLLLGLIVLLGFAPTFYLHPAQARATFPAHLLWHGVLLSLWYAWVVAQVSLVRAGRPGLHRRAGVIGALVGVVAVYAGPLATVGAIERLRARGLDWSSSMAEYPALGIESATLDQYTRGLVWGNFASALCFAVLLAGAVYWRRHADVHKRLITLASIAYIPPALARLSRWPGLGGEDGVFLPLCFLALLVSLVLHDRREYGRVHRATRYGLGLIVLVNAGAAVIALTPPGRAVVRSLAFAGQAPGVA